MAQNSVDPRTPAALPHGAGSGESLIATRAGRCGPAVLRQVCGAPAAYRRSRRGSFLVLVIGILALISAFMVIYVAVGRADQQLSASVGRSAIGLSDAPDGSAGESARDAVAEKFAKYAGQVIADDTFATFYTNADAFAVSPTGQGLPVPTIQLTREASDYPWTDWNRNSDTLASADPSKFFDPVGTYRLDMGTANVPQVWKPSDPWLASSEPVWMNYEAILNTTKADVQNEFINRKDWWQISNIAPDGQFVNLYNLRGSAAQYMGNFDADHQMMRAGLSLFDANGDSTNKTDFDKTAPANTPAYWTMRQRGAAMPIGADDGSPSAATFRPYQWADADGDGIYDSRWFEMVDPRLETGYDAENPKDVLGIEGGKYRYFFATRIIDLSGRVNVNTAGDFGAPPDTATGIAGATPADIDLRRLLGMEDAWLERLDKGFSYADLAQSNDTDDLTAENYLGYKNTVTDRITSLVGNRGYLSVGYTLDRGSMPRYKDVNQPGKTRFGDNTSTTGAKARAEYYATVGSSTSGITEDPTTSSYTKTLVKNPFGASDLIELLTYNGVNDPQYTSMLEGSLGGKFEGTTAGNEALYLRFSPLRDNRPRAVEWLGVPDGKFTTGNPSREEQIYAHLATDVRQRLTTLSGARPIKTDAVPVLFDQEKSQYFLAVDELSGSELKSLATTDAAAMFKAYARGLAPYSTDVRSWPESTGDFPTFRFLNYGYRSPELALRMAAQMAVNLKAMSNATGEPPMLTVALWSDMRNDDVYLDLDIQPDGTPVAWKSRQYPSSSWAYTSHQGKLEQSRLSQTSADSNGDVLNADAVNVYGLTPQPFISAAGSFSIFTDAKESESKDDPDSEMWIIGKPVDSYPEVEIKGDRDDANGDYIGDIFAVQLVNPFPTSLTLGSDIKFVPNDPTAQNAAVWLATKDRFDYYIEYAGRYYRLADWNDAGTPNDPSDDGPSAVTIGAGQSRVFYFTSRPLKRMEERLRAAVDTNKGAVALPNSSTGSPTALMDQWIQQQFQGASTNAKKPVYVEEFDPADKGKAIPLTTTSVEEITTLKPGSTTGSTKVVRLWRAMRDEYNVDLGAGNEVWDSTGEDATNPSSYKPVPDQNLANDLLVDRLRDPEGDTWHHTVPAGFNKVIGTHGWDWSTDPKELRNSKNDNRPSGMSFTLAGLVNRRGDEQGKKIDQTGMLPAYCLESAFGSTNLKNTATKTYTVDVSGSPFSKTLEDSRLGGAQILYKEDDSVFDGSDSWLGKQAFAVDSSITQPLYDTLGNAPSDWQVLDQAATGEALQSGAAGIPAEPGPLGRSFDSMRPFMYSTWASGSMRPADVLLPLAIGTQYSILKDETAAKPPASADELDKRWLTLAESWALALNYEYMNTALQNDSRWKIYWQFGESSPAATPAVYPATESGRLVIGPSYNDPSNPTPVMNAFVPFVDANSNGEFDRLASSANREDVSLGITPAMAIVEQFTTLTAGGAPSLTKAQLGVVNINTKPLAVARVLPMLNPTPEQTGAFTWWWDDQTGNNTQLNPSVDLAASIVAYRDKGWLRPRPDPANAAAFRLPVEFDDRDATGNPKADPTQDDEVNGRSGRSDFTGIREQPGFLTSGEVMGVVRRYQTPNVATTMPPTDTGNIDFMGWDVGSTSTGSKLNAVRKGVGSMDYTKADSVKNDYEFYEDKLLVPNAMLNSVSTRSDYFAVWFVMAGYRSSDVRGLSNTSPLVPSIQRRYVMVVDRSSVVRKGDKPRIVFFREVPN